NVFAASSLHYSDENMIKGNAKFLHKEFNGVPFTFVKAMDYKGNGKKRILNMIEYAYKIINITKKIDIEKPDVIYASSAHPLTWLAGYRLAKRYKAKFIAETRDLWPETLVSMGQISRKSIPAKILYKLQDFIYRKADRLIFTFPGGKDYVDSLGIDTNKVRYINNGIDLEEFNYNKDNFIYEDSDLDNDDKFKVIFTGTIGHANGIRNIVNAAIELKKKNYNDIVFLIFGDGPEKEKLIKKVEKEKIDNIIFKGRVQKKFVPNILSKSSLNLLSLEHLPNLFKYGLSPNKLFDYFASGTPTLSNVECGYDLLEQYNCGLTVKGDSTEALINGILKFYNMDREEYNKYGKNALEASEDFDFKKLTDKLEMTILD
ncbi:MAG: glycosyltransferase family 4 protein, partial [Tissierella sp.]|uniref:glycosyltransferase family 4 protein n=1 Tax=Tissierella sp. TaxID=41274 RepID=UPI003F964724